MFFRLDAVNVSLVSVPKLGHLSPNENHVA